MTERQRNPGTYNPLRSLWELWKRAAKRIGNFQARVLLTIFYFTLFCPFALAVQWSSDPLATKSKTRGGWRALIPAEGSHLDRARNQF